MKQNKVLAKEIALQDISGKEIDKIKLPKIFSDVDVKPFLLHRAVSMYQNNEKCKLAATKNRGDVSGGGAKPWRQKGTGRARVGSNRNPIWKGGGVAFGPIPRNSHYSIPKRLKREALRHSIIDRFNEKAITILDKLKIEKPKTKLLFSILTTLNIKNKVLLLLSESDENILFAARNIPFLEVKLASNVNAYDVLKSKRLVLTKAALQKIVDRIK
ncbi:MAG: 50S ribosomal protein L4 [Candidatus Omnitrophica bacterium]|nr:50S ribosomal protein L4 [Candidatus Omnitrophota bacterium]